MQIIPASDHFLEEANRLADRFEFSCLSQKTGTPRQDFWLSLDTEGLALQQPDGSKLIIDFSDKQLQYRRLHGGGLNQSLAKAIGIRSSDKPNILDTTAGFGKDSFILASLGCKVTLIERSSVIFALLDDAFTRASANPEFEPIISRMTLVHADSTDYLPTLLEAHNCPDVVYIDPMFPDTKKSALVNKDMQYLKHFLGADQAIQSLIQSGRSIAKKRVVIKRPKKAPLAIDEKPNFQLYGKTTRFDIYLPYS